MRTGLNSAAARARAITAAGLFCVPALAGDAAGLSRAGDIAAAPGGYELKVPSAPWDSGTGLKIYKPEKCYNGYTLFAHFQGGVPMPLSPVFLIDMLGEVAHQWMVEIPAGHNRLMPDGRLFYHPAPTVALRSAAAYGLYEVDPHSAELWHLPGDITHDFQVMDSSTVLVAEHDERDPEIKIVTRENKVLWAWKGTDHRDELEKLAGLRIKPARNWAHNNNASFLGETELSKKDRRFKKDNILFSFARPGVIGIIDYPSGRIVWTWGNGELSYQHSPEMLPNGHILIFDNGVNKGRSRVLEIDPPSGRIVWEYAAKPPASFFSSSISNATRLPNGNTLICDGSNSRIFEVTAEGETVWEFRSPFGGLNNGLGIYRAYRYSKEYVKPLFDAAGIH